MENLKIIFAKSFFSEQTLAYSECARKHEIDKEKLDLVTLVMGDRLARIVRADCYMSLGNEKDEIDINRGYRLFDGLPQNITIKTFKAGLKNNGINDEKMQDFIICLLLQHRGGLINLMAGALFEFLTMIKPKNIDLLSIVKVVDKTRLEFNKDGSVNIHLIQSIQAYRDTETGTVTEIVGNAEMVITVSPNQQLSFSELVLVFYESKDFSLKDLSQHLTQKTGELSNTHITKQKSGVDTEGIITYYLEPSTPPITASNQIIFDDINNTLKSYLSIRQENESLSENELQSYDNLRKKLIDYVKYFIDWPVFISDNINILQKIIKNLTNEAVVICQRNNLKDVEFVLDLHKIISKAQSFVFDKNDVLPWEDFNEYLRKKPEELSNASITSQTEKSEVTLVKTDEIIISHLESNIQPITDSNKILYDKSNDLSSGDINRNLMVKSGQLPNAIIANQTEKKSERDIVISSDITSKNKNKKLPPKVENTSNILKNKRNLNKLNGDEIIDETSGDLHLLRKTLLHTYWIGFSRKKVSDKILITQVARLITSANLDDIADILFKHYTDKITPDALAQAVLKGNNKTRKMILANTKLLDTLFELPPNTTPGMAEIMKNCYGFLSEALRLRPNMRKEFENNEENKKENKGKYADIPGLAIVNNIFLTDYEFKKKGGGIRQGDLEKLKKTMNQTLNPEAASILAAMFIGDANKRQLILSYENLYLNMMVNYLFELEKDPKNKVLIDTFCKYNPEFVKKLLILKKSSEEDNKEASQDRGNDKGKAQGEKMKASASIKFFKEYSQSKVTIKHNYSDSNDNNIASNPKIA